MVFRVYLLFNHFTELSVVQLVVAARIKFAKRYLDLIIRQVRANGHEFLNIKIIFNNRILSPFFYLNSYSSCYNSILAKNLTTLLMKIDLVEGLKR